MLKLLPITPIANTCAGSYRNRLGVLLVKIFNYEYDQSFSVLSRVTLNGLNIALDGEKCKFLKKKFFFIISLANLSQNFSNIILLLLLKKTIFMKLLLAGR